MSKKISVIGLGYVGLPVAVAFGHIHEVIGFDINKNRISELVKGFDRNLEVSSEELKATKIKFTSDLVDLRLANFHIITVPTPVSEGNLPDLALIRKASESIGSILKKDDIVVYESTVYPGVTEEICIPILEKLSGLRVGKDFGVGYSPERINPGDKNHTFTKIKKVVSGYDEKSLKVISETYSSVVTAGVHEATSLKVAEAAKVIENSQRDINIAFMNELALIFDKMNINTADVLSAASTKWNFLNFFPGLVGGHCIGVDPYYLTHKAEVLGYHPQVILAGRRINDNMSIYIASKLVKMMINNGHDVSSSTVTVLGLTFKENTPDIRNSKVADIVTELKSYGIKVQIIDPLAMEDDVEHEYGVKLTKSEDVEPAQAIVLAVGHEKFKNLTAEAVLEKYLTKNNPVVVGVRSHLTKQSFDSLKISNWFL